MRITAFLILLLGVASCQPKVELEPGIVYCPPQRLVRQLSSPFVPLSREEKRQDWAKELTLGRGFALETDYYRAITCFKRALFFIGKDLSVLARRAEIEYDIFLAYYLAGKYQESVEILEDSELFFATEQFPAYDELFILLYDAYLKNGQTEKACRILGILSAKEPEIGGNLKLGTALINADFPAIESALESKNIAPPSPVQESVQEFLCTYQAQAKSISKAEMLNALLPGAGYLYVGQKKTALTSFLINALFVAAAWQLFDRGYVAGGLIVSSLEVGWYLGGINGAGIEAREYNQYLYQNLGKELLLKNRLFPILMLEKGF